MRPTRHSADAPLRRSTIGALAVLFWVVVVMLVGARVAYFDEIRARLPSATVAVGPGARG